MRKNLLKTDMTALAGIACGALVGGLATVALAADGHGSHARDVEMTADCAVEGVTPRIVVTGRAESRVVVAPNVRIGVGSSCADGRELHVTMWDRGSDHSLQVYRLDGTDVAVRERMDRARERMERAQERMERARARTERARERAEAVRERMERGDWHEVDGRLRVAEAQLREQLVDIEARLADDLDEAIREELTREMRRLRQELDRALAESRGAGN